MAKREVWKRPEFKDSGEALETQAQSAERLGITLYQVRSYVRRYPKQFPAEVMVQGGRLTFRLVREVDEFMEWLTTRPKFRTPVEVTDGEVARLTLAREKAERRVERLDAALTQARRDLHYFEVEEAATRERARLLAYRQAKPGAQSR